MNHSINENGTSFTITETGNRTISISGTDKGLLFETGDDFYDTEMDWESVPELIDFLRTVRARTFHNS